MESMTAMAQKWATNDPIADLFKDQPLKYYRLSELERIADAYDIPRPDNATKDRLLRVLDSANSDGIFGNPLGSIKPKYPEMLLPKGQRPPTDQQSKRIKWGGPKHKWRVMQGDQIVQTGFDSREEAEDWAKES